MQSEINSWRHVVLGDTPQWVLVLLLRESLEMSLYTACLSMGYREVLCFCMQYLVHLVCSAVLSNPYGYRGLIRHGYPQLHVRDAVIVLTERNTLHSTQIAFEPQIFILYFLKINKNEEMCFSNLPYTSRKHKIHQQIIRCRSILLMCYNHLNRK